MQKEKRQYVRITPRKKAFAAMGKTFSGVCRLKDISLNGFSVGCIADIAPKHTLGEATLFLPDGNLEVAKLPCRIVYQDAESLPSFQSFSHLDEDITFKRYQCGIVFNGLTKDQKNQLTDFIMAIEVS